MYSTAAHLRNRQTKHDPEARYQAKRTLVRLLYRQGWERQRILDLFAVLDWMILYSSVGEESSGISTDCAASVGANLFA